MGDSLKMARLRHPCYVSAFLSEEDGLKLIRALPMTRDLSFKFSLSNRAQDVAGEAKSSVDVHGVEGELGNIIPYSNGHEHPKGMVRHLVIFRPLGELPFTEKFFGLSGQPIYMSDIWIKTKGREYIPLSRYLPLKGAGLISL